ncbi:hypothetical protein FJY70_04185 [candidate division WOR-3 bacterium]|nr:hypothetical protein [candidate division WOR-3 bacterium]
MSTLVTAFGRFQMDLLAKAILEVAGADRDAGGWGAAYCYGNRVETIRSAQPCAQDPDFARLDELRTDMALLCIGGPTPGSPRELRPYLRRESGLVWTFAHSGVIRREDQLDTGGRITDSRDPSERLFLYVLSRLDERSPVESLTQALDALGAEDDLSFCLLCAELVLVSCWYAEAQAPAGRLWTGIGEAARFFCTQPLPLLTEVRWEPMPNRAVLAVTRTRRELP